MVRHIVHMDMDTFFVSVERLKNSALIGKPVIVGGTSDRGVVASCSYEARMFGVHSAMPARKAKLLCPDAIFVRGDHDDYSKYSNIVTEIIAEQSPAYEKASIDEHYIDMTGMDDYFGSYKYSCEIRDRIIKETGLPISLGLSPNKTVSKIATGEAKPNGHREVQHKLVQPFLNPLSISKIPMVGKKNFYLLRNMGISTIGVLSEMPKELLMNVLGEHGRIVWERANGIDNTPIIPYWERKSISTERTFDKDTIDIKKLKAILSNMVMALTYQLRTTQKLTSCIAVKIRYSNFDTHTKQQRITYTASDHILTPKAHELFDSLFERRMLVRLIGVKFSYLVHGSEQMNLFEDVSEKLKLYQAMDKIRLRYGEKSIFIGSTHKVKVR